jgi:flagellar basal body P-ring formation protein FlgA
MITRQRNIDCRPLFAALLAVVLTHAALCQMQGTVPLQDVEFLRKEAATFVQKRLQGSDPTAVHAEAGTLDPRLRLPVCTQPPRAFSPSGELKPAARLTIGVRCDLPSWTVYVPVNVATEIAVLVTTRAMPRTAAITPQDVESQRRRVPGAAAGYIVSMDQLAGRHLRNAAAAGTALDVGMLSSDVLIKRGQRVTLIATAGGLEVRAQGEAIADAQPDGRVRALNMTSRRIVEGQAEGRDSIRIGF